MSGVDYALKRYSADPKRMGVTGYSYGGFLTNWAIGHIDRFTAAVVGAGLRTGSATMERATFLARRNRVSRPTLGTHSERGDDPSAAHYLCLQNPHTHAFVHGEADARVPISQAEEMYTTLQKQGVPAKFIRYPGEYHGGWSPWDTVHRFQQELLWWKKYLGS